MQFANLMPAGEIYFPCRFYMANSNSMAQGINKIIAAAVVRLLRPLVRLLLRNQVPYGAFTDLAKWVYADVASREFGIAQRKQTASRVSVITGLSRKEVARLQKIANPDDGVISQEYNRAVRVINGWLYDSRFVTEYGQPALLPIEGENSFFELVKDYSGDATPGAILDELLRTNAVEKTMDGSVHLNKRAYVPSESEEEIIHILGTDVALLLQTIDHNLSDGKANPYYQRKVAYNNLPVECLQKFRQISGEKAQALLEELNQYLMKFDRDANPNSEGTGRKHAGIGIYYFEEDVVEENHHE